MEKQKNWQGGITESVTNYACDTRGYLTKVSNAEVIYIKIIGNKEGIDEVL